MDGVLFGNGLTLADYFVRKSPVSEAVCYLDRNGQQFYLSIGNDELFKAALARLITLGVRIVVL